MRFSWEELEGDSLRKNWRFSWAELKSLLGKIGDSLGKNWSFSWAELEILLSIIGDIRTEQVLTYTTEKFCFLRNVLSQENSDKIMQKTETINKY